MNAVTLGAMLGPTADLKRGKPPPRANNPQLKKPFTQENDMQKPEGYETIEPMTQGEYESIPPGSYVCKIVSAEEKPTKTQRPMLVLSLDIAEGEHAGNYAEMSERVGKPIYLNVYQLTDGKSTGFFKGLIGIIEASNPPYKFNFDEKTLIGKRIGANLQEEEYSSNGEVKTALRVGHCGTVAEAKAGMKLLPKKVLAAGPSSTASYPSQSSVPMPSAPAPGDIDRPW